MDPEPEPAPWRPPTRTLGADERGAVLQALLEGRDAAGGFFGPASLSWEISRETALLIGGGRAVLMQLAHPAVAHAIRDRATVRQDMLGRFLRTMYAAYRTIFGSAQEALAISDRVYHIHSAISGVLDDVPGQPPTPYHALDPEALFWVGATLVDASAYVFERMVRPLSAAERDRMVGESAVFWALFGLHPSDCPPTWADLNGYVEQRVVALAPLVGDSARREAALLFQPKTRGLQPVFDELRLIAAETLPPPLRGAFHMELDSAQRRRAQAWLRRVGWLRGHLPEALRYTPDYHRAQRRLRGG